jgi:hypothetical protein
MEDTNTMRRANGERDTPARRALAYREAFLETVTADDVRAIGAALLERAKAGDLTAARLVLDRLLGTAPVADWCSRMDVEMDFLA